MVSHWDWYVYIGLNIIYRVQDHPEKTRLNPDYNKNLSKLLVGQNL